MPRFDPFVLMGVANSLCGIPYRANGSEVDGADCIGVVLLFYRALGIAIPYDNSHGYEERRYLASDVDVLLAGCRRFFVLQEHSKSLILPGHLLIFQHDERRVSTHLGVAVTGYEFLHMDRTRKVSALEKLRSHIGEFGLARQNTWSRKLKFVGRLRQEKWER
jgi:cell wall-associated NlpC family hydrolase